MVETGSAELGSSSRVSLWWLSEKFLVQVFARAVRTWEYGALVPFSLVSGSHVFGVQRIGFFRRSFFVRNAWLDCGYMFCIITGRFSDDFHIFSTLPWTQLLKFFSPFSRRMEKYAQQMLQSSVQLAMRTLTLFLISRRLAARMVVRNFWGTCVRHRCRVVPVPRESDSRVSQHMLHN